MIGEYTDGATMSKFKIKILKCRNTNIQR